MRALTKISSIFLAFSILLGFMFFSVSANAGFLESFLGNEVNAQVEPLLDLENNSQTLAILSPNISSLSISGKVEELDENLNILSGNALLPATSPLGVSDGTEIRDTSSDQISIYVVRKGDSISQIAEMFDVSVNTILFANDMKKSDKLVEGDILFILPISGLEHAVVKGQTLQTIAKLYKVDVVDIAIYNDISQDAVLAVGDKIIIPGGDMSTEEGDKPAANLSKAVTKDQNYYATHPIKNISGYFINPVPAGRKTQGLHGPGHRGIDIGAPTGTSIYASASGKVLATKTGCKVGQTRCGGGYGNMVIVQHSNGTKTLYAHMSALATKTGVEVNRGDVIGYVGNTGKSTGPHIHFEVFNAKNPGADWSWAK